MGCMVDLFEFTINRMSAGLSDQERIVGVTEIDTLKKEG